jgi:hypothetical protein
LNDRGSAAWDDRRVDSRPKEVVMSIESEASQDLALETEQAEAVRGGQRKSKTETAHVAKTPRARTLPLVVTVEATTPAVPGAPDPGADNSGPEADNC